MAAHHHRTGKGPHKHYAEPEPHKHTHLTLQSEKEAARPTRHVELTHPLHAYMTEKGTRPSAHLAALRAETIEATGRCWGMMVPPEQAHFLGFLAELVGARRVLEVGTFTGYSTLAIAEALPADGVVVTLDVSEPWTSVGRPFWDAAGVADKIDLRLGPAAATLDALAGQEFDFAFIDADKPNYDLYYERALALLRPGGLLCVDNVLWNGAVIDDQCADAETEALRALNAKVHADPRVSLSMLPVGDGLTLVRKRR